MSISTFSRALPFFFSSPSSPSSSEEVEVRVASIGTLSPSAVPVPDIDSPSIVSSSTTVTSPVMLSTAFSVFEPGSHMPVMSPEYAIELSDPVTSLPAPSFRTSTKDTSPSGVLAVPSQVPETASGSAVVFSSSASSSSPASSSSSA